MQKLSGAISCMVKRKRTNRDSFIVECSKISKDSQGNIKMVICDGEQTCKATICADKAKKIFDRYMRSKEIFQLQIRSFTSCNEQTKTKFETVITIQDYRIILPNAVKQDYKPEVINIDESSITVKKEYRRSIQTEKKAKLQQTQKLSLKLEDTKTKLNLDYSSDQNQTKTSDPKLDIDIRIFEKIEDLYQGLFNWEILVRVIDKSFRQFVSKQNREIQIVTFELIDRAGSLMEANCFGDQAVFLNEVVKTRGVYRISNAKIMEQIFKKQKSHKHSKYTLRFQSDTSIIPVRDFLQIPYNSNNFVRLSQISYEINTNQLYNFVGILIKVEAEKTIIKLDRDIIMQNFKIGDPITNTVVQGIIWNRQVRLDNQLLNRSVLLKQFKISNYKDTLNLNTTFKSEIIIHDLFKDCEHKWRPQKVVEERSDKSIKKLCQLATDIQHLERQTILSDINVWVKAINLNTKWYYDSCPKCKRASTPYNVCINCSYRVEQCLKRFLLNVELCDDTGSIFVTAFEDTAHIFLKNANMQDLQSMNDTQRKSYAEKCSFEAYQMRISSKKDGNGRINHNIISKPQIVDPKVQAQMNLRKIQKQLSPLNPYNYLH